MSAQGRRRQRDMAARVVVGPWRGVAGRGQGRGGGGAKGAGAGVASDTLSNSDMDDQVLKIQ